MGLLPLLTKISGRVPYPHLFYRRAVNLIPVDSQALDRFCREKELFLILSTGRTGTTLFSRILNECPGAEVVHEPVPNENYALVEASQSAAVADRYIHSFRRKEIYLRAGRSGETRVYGEVNGALRRHLAPLKASFARLKLLMIVRNGKDVVRSVMSRGTFSGRHPLYRRYRPPLIDFGADWERFSEFERCCWAWVLENRNMRSQIASPVRFEDIVSSYEMFSQGVLDPLGLQLDPAVWQRRIAKPVNETANFKLPDWSDWSEREKEVFRDICGDEMNVYDYPV